MTVPDISAEAHLIRDIAAMIEEIMAGYSGIPIEIRMDTTFHEDLEMESIDLVTLAGMLAKRYGPGVNLAEYLAEKDLDEIIELTIGDIVQYVALQRARD